MYFRPSSTRKKRYLLLPGVTLTAPVMQAALGSCDGVRLAATVSRAGGLGTLTVHNTNPHTLSRQLRRIRRITPRPVVLAFTSQWEPDAVLETALAEGFRYFQVSWWNGPRLAPRIRRAGGIVFWQIGSVAQAQEAEEVGCDALVVQGTEAGGQVRSAMRILPLLRELRTMFGDAILMIAGGGFADRRDTEAILDAGANAALFGTRFLLSEESSASPRHKARLLRAISSDLHLDTRLVGDWPCAPRRRLKHGDDHPGLFAGLGIGRMETLEPAATLLHNLTPRGKRTEADS